MFKPGWVFALFLVSLNSFAGDVLKAGFSEIPFDLPDGTPLGGYGTGPRRLAKPDLSLLHRSSLFNPALGTRDLVRAKALVLTRGKEKLAFLSLDLVAVSAGFRKELVRRLKLQGYSFKNLMVSATHTHSGPGALSHNLFWAAIALDFYRKPVFEAVLRAAVDAVIVAEHHATPAVLSYSKANVGGIQHNRHGHPDRVDPGAKLLWAKSTEGSLLGVLANFAIHGTALDEENLFFSADVPGAIEHSLVDSMRELNRARGFREASEPVALFLNGAEGDVLPDREGADALPWVGAIFSNAAMSSLEGAKPVASGWSVDERRIPLPVPGMNIKNCINEFRPDKKNAALKLFTKDSALHLAALFFPLHTRIARIRFGGLQMLTWPGEPTTQLGWNLRDLALENGAADTMILGLTNDHLGYFLTSDEFYEGGYEGCFSFYGARGGEKIIGRYRKLIEECSSLE